MKKEKNDKNKPVWRGGGEWKKTLRVDEKKMVYEVMVDDWKKRRRGEGDAIQ